MRRIFFAAIILAIGVGAVFSVAHYMNAYDVFHKRISTLEYRIGVMEQGRARETEAHQIVLEILRNKNILECATFSKKVFGNDFFLRYDDGRASKAKLEYNETSSKPKLGSRVAVTRTPQGTLLVFASSELCK